MTEILITGATGQLGSELRNLLDERNVAYDAFDSHGLDITDEETVMKRLKSYSQRSFTTVQHTRPLITPKTNTRQLTGR